MKQVPLRLAEATKALCRKKTLENITVSEIAAEAELTRQVFYHYFNDKYELASWIHYADLYQAMKKGTGEEMQYSWRNSTREWLSLLLENRSFYANAFQSASQNEFQRIIKEFFFTCHKGMLELIYKQPATEEQVFLIHFYCTGAMEKVYDWISKGAQMPINTLVDYLEKAMPEAMKVLLTSSGEIPYSGMLNDMEKYLYEQGLL